MFKSFKQIVAGAVLVALVVVAGASSASAQATSTNALLDQLQELLQQVRTLQDQLLSLQTQQGAVQAELQSALKLSKSLYIGLTGEEVTLLQEILATDPDIYPEGLITGYFGPLTEKAVKKFQAKYGIDQVGVVGPITRSRINQLLAEGAGNSGKVPPGFLIAPGIAKKLGFNPQPLPGQKIPPGIAKKLGLGSSATSTPTTTPDITPPVVSNLEATSTASTTAKITWTTDEATKTMFWFSTSTPVATSSAANLTDNTLQTSHIVDLTSLQPNTTYYFSLTSKDLSDNMTVTTGSVITKEE